MKESQLLLVAVPLVLTLTAGCRSRLDVDRETAVPRTSEAQRPSTSGDAGEPGTPPLADSNTKTPAPPPVSGRSAFSGEVAETMSTGRYTYVLVDTGEGRVWVAAPEFEVEVGDEVTVSPGVTMVNFHSRTLDRTFDRILFVARVTVKGRSENPPPATDSLPPGHPSLSGEQGSASLLPVPPAGGDSNGLPPGHVPIGNRSEEAGEVGFEEQEIARAERGMTVAEIHAARKELAGERVLLRGRVVKFTARILGTNWLHVRDGSEADAANDMTVRTDAQVQIGDVVLIDGKVAIDRDFGAGYRYDVLIEEAAVTVE